MAFNSTPRLMTTTPLPYAITNDPAPRGALTVPTAGTQESGRFAGSPYQTPPWARSQPTSHAPSLFQRNGASYPHLYGTSVRPQGPTGNLSQPAVSGALYLGRVPRFNNYTARELPPTPTPLPRNVKSGLTGSLERPARRHRRGDRRHRRHREGRRWERFLCMEDGRHTHDASSRAWRARSAAPAPMWEEPAVLRSPRVFKDGPEIISIDSTEDEYEWDEPPTSESPVQPGPYKGQRYADEVRVTIRDLFPWLSSIMDICCCPKKETAIVRSRGKTVRAGQPKLETVCLDCGHVLARHPIPGRMDPQCPVDRYDLSALMGTADPLTPTSANGLKLPKYEGYPSWEVRPLRGKDGARSRKNANKTPLPRFHNGPTRVFYKSPDAGQRRQGYTDDDVTMLDENGRVRLPRF